MTMRKPKPHGPFGRGNDRFPPEADGTFDLVPEKDIAEWRDKLNERFDIGKKKLTVIDDPATA